MTAPTPATARKYQPTTTTTTIYQPIHTKRCFEIYTVKEPVLKPLFNKVPGLQPAALSINIL